MEQILLYGSEKRLELRNILNSAGIKRPFVVCKGAVDRAPVCDYICHIEQEITYFSSFSSNPKYEEAQNGLKLFLQSRCDAIVAIGGGSAIDVAKCIKYSCGCGAYENSLASPCANADIHFIVMPTTAGTGSESTCFAVIYKNGEKISIEHKDILPQYVILEPEVLITLPLYEKKCTLSDALCQAIESWWSVNSTDESIAYSKSAIRGIVDNMEGYLADCTPKCCREIMIASNLAGKAINITRTTAAHAMSYKLTSLYGLPHGNAVMICLPYIWRYMADNMDRCIDKRGSAYLEQVFCNIARALRRTSVPNAIEFINGMVEKMNLTIPKLSSNIELRSLVESVNTQRLKNNPIALSDDVVECLYREILKSRGLVE